jgi:hypothetical protein
LYKDDQRSTALALEHAMMKTVGAEVCEKRRSPQKERETEKKKQCRAEVATSSNTQGSALFNPE